MASSVSWGIMEAMQTRIRALTLPGLDDVNVVIATDARLANRTPTNLPGIIITTIRSDGIEVGEGTNEEDQIVYRYLVAIVDDIDGGLLTNNLDSRLLWSENLRKGLQHFAFPTLTSVWDCRLEPLAAVDKDWLPRNLFVAAFVANVYSLEARGVA